MQESSLKDYRRLKSTSKKLWLSTVHVRAAWRDREIQWATRTSRMCSTSAWGMSRISAVNNALGGLETRSARWMDGNAGERADLTKGDETRRVVRGWRNVGDQRILSRRQYADVFKDGLGYHRRLVLGQDSEGKTRGKHTPDERQKNKGNVVGRGAVCTQRRLGRPQCRDLSECKWL